MLLLITVSLAVVQETAARLGAATGRGLLDLVRQVIRSKHYSRRTEETYIDWITRYVRFHKTRHPRELGSHAIVEAPISREEPDSVSLRQCEIGSIVRGTPELACELQGQLLSILKRGPRDGEGCEI